MAIEFIHIQFKNQTKEVLSRFFDWVLSLDKVRINFDHEAWSPQNKKDNKLKKLIKIKTPKKAKELFLKNHHISMIFETDNEYPAHFSVNYKFNMGDRPDQAVISFNSARYAYEHKINGVPFNDYIKNKWLSDLNEKFDILKI
ncbi:hypothetical protein ACFL1H_06710 [Nanoarchaeota archaeon]